MATINAPATERRHIPERRTSIGSARASSLSALDWAAMLLMIIGGINWGLIGAFEFDLVAQLFGSMTPLSRLVYVVVGVAALYGIYLLSKMAARKR